LPCFQKVVNCYRSAYVISLLLALRACGIFLSNKSIIQQKKTRSDDISKIARILSMPGLVSSYL
jgi:hypothetical protein